MDEPIPQVGGPEDDLIDRLLVDNIPLNSLRAFADFSDDGAVAGNDQGRKAAVDAEVVEGSQNRIPVPFRGLFVVLRQG
jgi:hypothetical protein